MKYFISRFLSPILLATVIGVASLAIQFHWNYGLVYGACTVALVLLLVSVETFFPLRGEWKMTGRSFQRDLKYIFLGGPVIGLTKAAMGYVGIWYSMHHKGLFVNAPLIWSIVLFLLAFEFVQYWYHRLSHTGKGKIGKFLWNVHLAHHLPEKVYVVMHAVFNPINAFINTTIIQLTLIVSGISPEAALMATLLIDLQSLVSHFNVNIRAGWLNYVFIGTETHRFHHSADLNEARNFGNTLAIWDIVFGTFYYRPKEIPLKLGVENPDFYPAAERILQVISFPFKDSERRKTTNDNHVKS